QGQVLVPRPTKEVGGPSKPLPEVAVVDVARPQTVDVPYVKRTDREEAGSILGRLRRKAGVEDEKVARGQPQELTALARCGIAIGRGFEVWVEMRPFSREP